MKQLISIKKKEPGFIDRLFGQEKTEVTMFDGETGQLVREEDYGENLAIMKANATLDHRRPDSEPDYDGGDCDGLCPDCDIQFDYGKKVVTDELLPQLRKAKERASQAEKHARDWEAYARGLEKRHRRESSATARTHILEVIDAEAQARQYGQKQVIEWLITNARVIELILAFGGDFRDSFFKVIREQAAEGEAHSLEVDHRRSELEEDRDKERRLFISVTESLSREKGRDDIIREITANARNAVLMLSGTDSDRNLFYEFLRDQALKHTDQE